MELNKIYNCDCLDFMKTLPDKCIDLCLTDPPYGIGYDVSANKASNTFGKCAVKTSFKKTDWDSEIPRKEIFEEIFRISKNQIIFGGNYFVEYLYNSSCWLVWDKHVNGNFADCELAWTSFTTAIRKFDFTWNGMIQENMKEKEKRVHPTQKPVKLGEWILEKYAKQEDIIFDPFACSGTFLVSAQNLGFKYMGCELDKDYFEIAEKRLGFVKQRLF